MGRWQRTQISLAEGAASSAQRKAHDSLANGIQQGVLQERSRIAQALGLDIGTVALLGSDQSEVTIQITADQPEDPKYAIEGEV